MHKQIYEISFWSLVGSGVQVETNILELLKDFNFQFLKKNPPKTKNLAYPINNQINGEFGTIYFEVDESNIAKLRDFHNFIKKNKNIIRFIILKKKKKSRELMQIFNAVNQNQEKYNNQS